MKFYQIKLLFIILFITPLSYAGIVSSFIKNIKNIKIQNIKKLLEKKPIEFPRLNKRQEENMINVDPPNYMMAAEIRFYKEKALRTQWIKSRSKSFKIIYNLSLLAPDKLFSRMKNLASPLKIQPSPAEPYELLLAFTFFLELKDSGTQLQQDLVTAIIDFSKIEHFYSSQNDLSLEEKDVIIPFKFWTILMEDSSRKKILDYTLFFNDTSIRMLKDHLKS